MKTLLLYMPVFHQGYARVIAEVKPERIVLIDQTIFYDSFPELAKDLRALNVAMSTQLLQEIYPDVEIDIFLPTHLPTSAELVMCTDQLSRWVAEQYLSNQSITWYSAFLRWDKERVLQPQAIFAQVPEKITTTTELMAKLQAEAQLSSDWWRQVAAALVHNDQVLQVAHNTHTPTEFEPYYHGDARSLFHKGEYVEVNTSLHAEAAVIGAAAKRGQALDGTELYVTTFPCPYCARLIAHTGIKRLYYAEGYSMLDGESYLRSAGVALFQVKTA